MAVQTATQISRTGVVDLDAATFAVDAGGTDKCACTGNEFLYVNNGNAGPLTITLTYAAAFALVDGQTLPNRTVVVAAGKRALIGPFPTNSFADVNGQLTVAWSLTATVKALFFKWTPN